MMVRDHSRSLKMALFDRSHTISYWGSTETMAISCVISETKWQRYWFSHTATAFDTPTGGSLSENCHNVWYRKTRIGGYQRVKYICFDTMHESQMDRHCTTAMMDKELDCCSALEYISVASLVLVYLSS